jgi:hypothetical protein
MSKQKAVTLEDITRVMRELGRRYGSKAGKTAAANMTPEARVARATKASRAAAEARRKRKDGA